MIKVDLLMVLFFLPLVSTIIIKYLDCRLPIKESIQFFWLTKDDPALKTLGIQSTPCKHGMDCSGWARDSNETRIK
jgi:hypothetical protein